MEPGVRRLLVAGGDEVRRMQAAARVFVFGVFPKWILDPLGIDASFIRVFTVMRALRLARLARAVRLKPAFKER
eukprot:Skav212814  [mRNA]  locus=scaffold4580:1515:8694:- [translate_table: standard]